MILLAPTELRAGMAAGVGVRHPADPETVLVGPGVELTDETIRGLLDRGVPHLWIHHPGTEDLEPAARSDPTDLVATLAGLLRERVVLSGDGLVSVGVVQSVRTLAMELITELMARRAYAGHAARVRGRPDPFFAHAANVAFLGVLIGLELEPYLVRERSRLEIGQARDLTSLAIGAALHDVGKLGHGTESHAWHEVGAEGEAPTGYRLHPEAGRRMLARSRAPAPAVQAVLLHHQRWSGDGWPDVTRVGFPEPRPLRGREIHVFARIVGVANALENLLARADGRDEAPATALAALADRLHEGWFDPVVHAAALRAIAPFPVGSRVTLSDGAECVVVAPNRGLPCRPVVRPLEGADPESTIDLAEAADLGVARCLGRDVAGLGYAVPPMDADGRLRAA
jgi:HD-GYP domain-containing protein (c-di-GMP phosphodiesterase class II)